MQACSIGFAGVSYEATDLANEMLEQSILVCLGVRVHGTLWEIKLGLLRFLVVKARIVGPGGDMERNEVLHQVRLPWAFM